MSVAATGGALDEARRAIDCIDDRMFELLRERAALVDRVTAAKRMAGEEGRPALRPEREAQVLRRLYRRSAEAGDFDADFDATARIWREVMAAGLSRQAPVSVGLLPAEGETGQALPALVRQQFGGGCRIHAYPAAGDLFAAVRRQPNLVGVLPGLAAYLAVASGQAEALPVFASLPFWGAGARDRAFAFGHVRLAPSGDDVTLVAVALHAGMTAREPAAALAAAGMEVAHRLTAGSRALYAVAGYWAEGEPRAALDRVLAGCGDWELVGAHARPLPESGPGR